MTTYTVVLHRPLTLSEAADTDWATDIYVAVGIDADNPLLALRLAQAEAYASDAREWGEKAMNNWCLSPIDYVLSVMFEGHHEPCLFGWQSY